MILKIEGLVPEKSCVYVSCCRQVKTIDALDKSAIFCVPEPGSVEVQIEEKSSKSNHTFIQMLLFLLTGLIQGIFNILLMNVDSAWYKGVRAYNIKGRCFIEIKQDMSIQFKISETKYIEHNSTWEYSSLSFEQAIPFEVTFQKNPQSISNEYCSYIMRVISVAMVLMLVLILLLFIAITHGSVISIMLILGLIAGVLALVLWLARKEYKRYRALSVEFLSSVQSEIG